MQFFAFFSRSGSLSGLQDSFFDLIITFMEQRRPEIVFSTLTGIIMMIFTVGAFTDRELLNVQISPLGFPIEFSVSSMELLIPLAAVIIVFGMYRALKEHLPVSGEQISLHLFLPFAVTLTIGFTLRGLDGGLSGWGLLFLTGVLLYLVLRFEYVACDPASARRPVSIMVLDGLCYAVVLLFIIALRAGISLLPVSVPAIFILCFVVSLKIYSFHIINSSIYLTAGVTGAVMAFAGMGLHFWPVNIVSYASLMFLWYYAFINLVIGKDHGEPYRSILRRISPAAGFALIVMVYAAIRL